jgi:hypothetical protein
MTSSMAIKEPGFAGLPTVAGTKLAQTADGTTAGAACLPDAQAFAHVPLSLTTIASQNLSNLASYQTAWRKLAYENTV